MDASHTRVTHTYDWSRLTDAKRMERARTTTTDRLQASVDRLAEIAERAAPAQLMSFAKDPESAE
jgi:hypothetical protein